MVYQVLLTIVTIVLCTFYMGYTLVYYKYCDYSLNTGNYFVMENKTVLYSELCKEMYRDYSNHTLLKKTLNKFYEVFKSANIDEKELEYSINNIEFNYLKNLMRILKFIHLIVYGVVIYLLIVIFPIYFLQITKYVMSKFLFVIFITFIIDAVAKIFFDVNLDFLQIFESNFYLNSKVFIYFSDIYGYLKNFTYKYLKFY